MVKRYVGNLSDDYKRELINRLAPPDLVTKQQTTREEEKRFVCEQKEIVKKKEGENQNEVPLNLPPLANDGGETEGVKRGLK